MSKSLTNLNVVERLNGVVEVNRLNEIHSTIKDSEVVAKLVYLRAGKVGNEVKRAALERHDYGFARVNDLVCY